ncbi:hypothetical protein EUX98_g232 [Antrodiella citrinella]|uniref:CDP-diacylglycerol--inositol 3-phosphatidyltransferase n=1 Tax=Antrodiella citrinella TaxID=2447956 RepID=A0A4S4N4C6_9APHY|nr:hypothetical protein EUX98_g232 [Antrodiella citrinella]
MVFQLLITLDFSSHYMHMYSSLITGSSSHKSVKSDVSYILSLYYNPTLLFLICTGNELFFIGLYLVKWVHTPLWLSLGIAPVAFANLTWAEAMAWACFPVCLLKNVINAVQLWKASKILVGVDLAERAHAREEKLKEKEDPAKRPKKN